MNKIFYFLAILFAGLVANAQTLDQTQIATLKQVMLNNIQTLHAPEGATDFRGSFDWHSDVHAHWALLSIARVTKDNDLEKKMLSILTLSRLEKEYAFLMAPENSVFEKPYGRTWFLLILWELNHREISKSARFQKIRYDLTQDMLTWLRTSSFPENEFSNDLIGTHQSWLMSLFLFDTAKSENVKTNKAITTLVKSKMMILADKIEAHKMEESDFLFLPALKYLINPQQRYQNDFLSLPKTNEFACHYPGAIQVSLWAYAGQCARHDQKACLVVKSVTQDFYQQTLLWKDNFDCVTHWVPQFTWMTHWLSLGKP